MDRLDRALDFVNQGNFAEAKLLFEDMLLDNPTNADILYNLGMCFTELREPEKAITVLNKSIQYNQKHSNSYVALGYAYSKKGDNETAKKYFIEALQYDTNNSYAMRNLGALFGKSGDLMKSLQYLEQAYLLNPADINTVYGLGYSYQQLKDYKKADLLYQKVLEMNAPTNVQELARDGRREIAMINLKSKGLRMDAVMYMLSSLRLFEKEGENRIKEITFEIALKGRGGLDINNPDKKYTIDSLPGEFTGLQLVSYMYVGFKKLASNQDTGIDLSQEYAMALILFEGKQ